MFLQRLLSRSAPRLFFPKKALPLQQILSRYASSFSYKSDPYPTVHNVEFEDQYKRDVQETEDDRRGYTYFMYGITGVTYGIAAKNFVVDYLTMLAPTSASLIVGETEVALADIPEGKTITTKWRKKPVFVRHRTQEEIEKAVADDKGPLRDPELDSQRVKNPEWLVVIGVCTHLGCVPISGAGDYGGWFCPCHGSHYDISGRIRKGPAPKNLEVPPYVFQTEDDKLIIGKKEGQAQ